jgi:hypothetical protein
MPRSFFSARSLSFMARMSFMVKVLAHVVSHPEPESSLDHSFPVPARVAVPGLKTPRPRPFQIHPCFRDLRCV